MKLFSLIASLIFVNNVNAYGTGVDTCISVPQHGSWAQGCNPNNCFPVGGGAGGTIGGQVTYMIDLLDNTDTYIRSYIPNTQYIGILRNTNTSIAPCSPTSCFKGFILTVGSGRINGNFARVSESANSSSGIINLDPTDINVRRMTSCNNGITHVSNNNLRRINFQWTSPPAGSGPVTFKSVIVSSRTAFNYVATFILNEAVVFSNITISNTPSTSLSSSTTLSSTNSRTMRPSRTPSITSSNTHSISASITVGVEPSVTSSASYSSSFTPSTTVSNSQSSSITQSVNPTPSNTDTPVETDSRTPSLTPNILPSYSSSPSQTGTNTPTNTPSHTSSYTSEASNSLGSSPTRTALPSPSVIVSESTTSTYSPTLGSSHSATQTNDPNFITIITNREPTQSQTISNIGSGIAIGILVTITLLGAFYIIHKRNLSRSKAHSMRSVIFMKESIDHESNNPSFGMNDPVEPKSPQFTRVRFEPTKIN